MNGKDLFGLITLLTKELKSKEELRDAYVNDPNPSQFNESRISELGVEAADYRYYIRLLEESEVTLR